MHCFLHEMFAELELPSLKTPQWEGVTDRTAGYDEGFIQIIKITRTSKTTRTEKECRPDARLLKLVCRAPEVVGCPAQGK